MAEKKSTLAPITPAGSAASKLFQRTEQSKLIKSLSSSEEKLAQISSGLEDGSKALEKLIKNLEKVNELEQRAIDMGLSQKTLLALRSKREQDERQIEKHRQTLNELEQNKVNESIKVAQLRNRVNVMNMPISTWSSKMLKSTLKQEETKSKILFKSLGKAWQSSATMRSGLSDVLSPLAGPFGSIFSEFLPVISAAKSMMTGIARIGKGSYEFFTGINRKNKRQDMNLRLLDAAQEISKSTGINMQNVQIQLDNIIKEAKNLGLSDKAERNYVANRIADLTNEYIATLTQKMSELPTEIQNQFSGFILELQKLSKEAIHINDRTLEEALEAKQQRIDFHKEQQRMVTDAQSGIINAVMDSAKTVEAATMAAADYQIDEANQARLRGITTGKTGIFGSLGSGLLGFLSPLLGKFKGLLFGLPLLLWGVLKLLPNLIWGSIKGIGKLITGAIKWALGPIFKLFSLKKSPIPTGDTSGIPTTPDVTGSTSNIPTTPDGTKPKKGVKPKGRFGKIFSGAGRLVKGAGRLVKVAGPIGIAVASGMAISDFVDGFDDEKAKKIFGSSGTFSKIATGMSSVLSGLTFNLVPMETFASGIKSIIDLGPKIIPAFSAAKDWLIEKFGPALAGAKDWLIEKAIVAGQTVVTGAKTAYRSTVKLGIKAKEFTSNMYNTLLAEATKAGLKNPEVIAKLGTAQSSLETGYGKHAPGQNYFGIKGAGGSQKTKEFINGQWVTVNDSFRQYGSMEESAKGYIEFLKKNKRYRKVLESGSIDEAVELLGKTGYATDPEYARKLVSIVRGIPVNRTEAKGKTPNVGDAAKAIRIAENSVLTATQKKDVGIFTGIAKPTPTTTNYAAPVNMTNAGISRGSSLPERWNLTDPSVQYLVFQNTVS